MNSIVFRQLLSRFSLICLVVFSAFSCAPDSGEKTRSGQNGFGLGGDSQPDDFYCPSGYTYDRLYHLCEGVKGALGPFSFEMIDKCKSFGGGSACEGLHWQTEFTHGIRGTGRCPVGTHWDTDLEVCTSGAHVFGPFLKSQYQKCVVAAGGPACDTMRWSLEFFESFRGSSGNGEAGDISSRFNLAEPSDSEISEVVSLWATYYRIPTVQNRGSSGVPLLDMGGNSLGVSLSRYDWCTAALEGSVRVVDSNGKDTVFNFAGTRDSFKQTDCSDYVSLPGLVYSRFYAAKGAFGDGVAGYHLKPYRTIAVDPSYIPYGTLIYVPSARGTPLVMADGKQAVHDGYFFAADTGGALQGKHIDVFIGSSTENPFQFVRSNKNGLFKAYIINSREKSDRFESVHKSR
jgi:3D (Asp-Asp-Asp) domain-containing protein